MRDNMVDERPHQQSGDRKARALAFIDSPMSTASPSALTSGTSLTPLATHLTSTPHQLSVSDSSPSPSMMTGSPLDASYTAAAKRDTYKDRRKHYMIEKKKVADELMSTLCDPTVVVIADWLKVRSALKQWTKYWCELKPGLLLLHKTPKTYKSGNWLGTIIVTVCELIERPSKKNGFCFKLFHPLEHPIWAPKGPHGESFTSIMFPLPMTYLIFRAPSESAGKKWMEAIELSLHCSSLLVRHMGHRESVAITPNILLRSHGSVSAAGTPEDVVFTPPSSAGFGLNDSDIEKHFGDHDIDDDGHTDHGGDSQDHHSSDDSDSDDHVNAVNGLVIGGANNHIEEEVLETTYQFDGGNEEFGIAGDAGQTEEVADENKSLIWTLLKQVRPGMDLSKVVLPTFILEPRSFLDKLTDYYYHCDIISKAVVEEDPLIRMKLVVKWYLSGFYKKPKGLKKPYNPILGETFRCYWWHPETESRTFYIAEQVSHHPPVSAFYVSNRRDGFCISGSILAKSKFYGNSISAILDGTARLSLLSRGEDYLLTFPYAHCKGILLGTLALELGGKVGIVCEKTGYHIDLEFKLKPFLGSADLCNFVTGKIRLGNETMGTIEGHWDGDIYYKDKRVGEKELFWSPSPAAKAERLKRFVVPLSEQGEFESERLWHGVTLAIQRQDQIAATVEKTKLEEEQRRTTKERITKTEKWLPKLFLFDNHADDWLYRYADCRPWDTRTDVHHYERDFVIQTKTRHRTPNLVVSGNASVISVEQQNGKSDAGVAIRSPKQGYHLARSTSCASEDSSSVGLDGPDSTESDGLNSGTKKRYESLVRLLEPIQELQEKTNTHLTAMQSSLESLLDRQNIIQQQLNASMRTSPEQWSSSRWSSLFRRPTITSDIFLIVVIILTQLVLNWLIRKWQ